jgi:hypothetical protein
MDHIEKAGWLADKIVAYDDYTKEAAWLLKVQAERIDKLEQQAILRDLEIVRLREALSKLVESCEVSNDACYGTLSTTFVNDIAEDALSTPIDLSAIARHDEEIVGPWKKDAERYRWLRTFNVDSYLANGDYEKLDQEIDSAIDATKWEKE